MINRDSHKRNYTVMSNAFLRDKDISIKAKGLLALLLTYPDDWKFNYEHLINATGMSVKTLRKVVNELTENGYLQISRKKDGNLYSYEWIIYESRYTNFEPTQVEPTQVEPTQKGLLLNTNIQSNE